MLTTSFSLSSLKEHSILVVDDDEMALDYLAKILSIYFKTVHKACNGEEAMKLSLSTPINIILTDYKMPIKDGADFVEEIREHKINIPVVFMSAHKDPDILLKVIPLHVNDYILKPLNIPNVLDVLVNALSNAHSLAHTKKDLPLIVVADCITVDIHNKRVKKEDEDILLTKKEFDLLELLILNRQSVLTQEQIEQSLWMDSFISDSAVKSLIKKLRNKIGFDSIHTVSNIGYTINIK